MTVSSVDPLSARLIDSLYTEAMLLADEARSYFEDGARRDRMKLDPLTRVGFSCESLKVTTRMMHIIAWLINRRAIGAEELASPDPRGAARKLGQAMDSDTRLVEKFPEDARTLIAASCDLYARVRRLEGSGSVVPSPARALMARLEQSL